MNAGYPLRVLLMDDDFYALKWNTALIMRDPRTTVIGEAEQPAELLDMLAAEPRLDVVVIDVEYAGQQPPLGALLTEVRAIVPEAAILCLSQYGETETIKTALEKQVKGFLLKRELRMAVVPAIVKAFRAGLVLSPSIAAALGDELYKLDARIIPAWRPNPRLTPQLMKSFWLRVFFGMRASLAAEELTVETTTIEHYVNQAYRILPDAWADEEYLFDVDLTQLSPEDQAFVWFTLPPRKKQA